MSLYIYEMFISLNSYWVTNKRDDSLTLNIIVHIQIRVLIYSMSSIRSLIDGESSRRRNVVHYAYVRGEGDVGLREISRQRFIDRLTD